MSMYRIGPSDTFSNGDLQADAATLDTQIGRIDDMDMTKVSQTFFDGWMSFRSEWKRFYSDVFLHSFLGPAWNDSNRDQLIQFEDRAANWTTLYTTETKVDVPDIVTPSTGAGDTIGAQLANQLRPLGATLSAYKGWAIGIAIVAGIIFFREPLKTVASTLAGKVK